MKKAIILCMSCNQERFINEEIIIKKTWGKDIIEGKYDNLSLYFYRGGSEKDFIDVENNVIHLTSGDELNDTAIKTIDCFKYLNENISDFDFIIRTNTSTYINIDALLQFLTMKDLPNDVMVGPHLTINGTQIPYLGGHYLIIPKNIVTIIIDLRSKYKIYGIDDAVVGILLQKYYGNNYFNHIREIDSIRDMKKSYYDLLPTAYCVRIKDEENLENNAINMIGLHVMYKTCVKLGNISPPHGFKNIITLYGQIPID